MIRSNILAQASSGASNASDFQPPTKNPQDIPSNVFQQQGGLQTVNNPQEVLNDQQHTRISVPVNPAPAVTRAKSNISGDLLGIIIVVIAVAAFSVIYRASNKQAEKEAVKTEVETPSTEDKPKETPAKKPAKPKAATKTKKSKSKKKRARR